MAEGQRQSGTGLRDRQACGVVAGIGAARGRAHIKDRAAQTRADQGAHHFCRVRRGDNGERFAGAFEQVEIVGFRHRPIEENQRFIGQFRERHGRPPDETMAARHKAIPRRLDQALDRDLRRRPLGHEDDRVETAVQQSALRAGVVTFLQV